MWRAAGRAILLLGALRSTVALAAGAAPARVTVIRGEAEDATFKEIANRTRAELAATGVDTRIVGCPSEQPICDVASLPASPPDDRVTAVVSTSRRAHETVSEVRVVSPDGRTFVRRLRVGATAPGTDSGTASSTDSGTEIPAVIALRAAELVQVALLEAAALVPEGAAPSMLPSPADGPPVISYDFEQPPAPQPSARTCGWFVGGGGAVLANAGGLGGAYGVMVRAGYAGVRWPALTVATLLAAPALAPDLRVPEGKVSTRQELAALEISHRWRWRRAVQPRVLLGVGVHHLRAQGTTSGWTTFDGAADSVWSAVVNAGAGVVVSLEGGVGLFADAQVALVRPSPVIIYGDHRARVGAPSLLGTLGVQRIF